MKKENPFNFYNDYQNLKHSTTWKLGVLRITSTQIWKITSMWKFSFCKHLSSPYWPMSEQNFYPQVQILHRCIVSSLWAEPTKRGWKSSNWSFGRTRHKPELEFIFWITQTRIILIYLLKPNPEILRKKSWTAQHYWEPLLDRYIDYNSSTQDWDEYLLILKNIPVRYDLKQYQPYTNTSSLV